MFTYFLIPTDGSPETVRNVRANVAPAPAGREGHHITHSGSGAENCVEGHAYRRPDCARFNAPARDSGMNRVDAIGEFAKVAGFPLIPMIENAAMPCQGIVAIEKT